MQIELHVAVAICMFGKIFFPQGLERAETVTFRFPNVQTIFGSATLHARGLTEAWSGGAELPDARPPYSFSAAPARRVAKVDGKRKHGAPCAHVSEAQKVDTPLRVIPTAAPDAPGPEPTFTPGAAADRSRRRADLHAGRSEGPKPVQRTFLPPPPDAGKSCSWHRNIMIAPYGMRSALRTRARALQSYGGHKPSTLHQK